MGLVEKKSIQMTGSSELEEYLGKFYVRFLARLALLVGSAGSSHYFLHQEKTHLWRLALYI